jgi:diguanylate cyclase (GGDEF)-like protein
MEMKVPPCHPERSPRRQESASSVLHRKSRFFVAALLRMTGRGVIFEGACMTQIVTGCLSPETVVHLERRLGEVGIRAANSGREVLQALGGDPSPLLILNHSVESYEVLREIQRTPQLEKTLVLYCLGAPERHLAGALVKERGVHRVLFHPLDPEELCRQVASILAIPLLTHEAEEKRKILEGVASAWEGLAPLVAQRLDVLEQAHVAMLEGRLSPELRQRAEREAHNLAGLLGTVGFAAGSRFTLEMEHILQGGTRQSEPNTLRFSDLVVALRLELEKTPVSLDWQYPPAEQLPLLLIAVPDPELAERLAVEAVSRRMRVETAAGLDAATSAVAAAVPDVVLLDLGFPEGPEQGLKFLAELSARTPPVPALVLTAHDRFTDRVEVARYGGRGFLSRSLAPDQILEAVADLLHRLRARDTLVMAVDDDRSTLLALRALLEPRGIAVTTLDDPLRFWEVFAECSPDLLLLDVEMPHLNGIELCRVVRNDASRAVVPVIFLTVHTDPDTVHRVFAAGADDFVSKPIVGPELVTRIFNRLERSRLHRSAAEIDPLTGVANRRKSAAVLEQFLRLAERHGQPLCLGVMTLDRFREINTQYGHAAADEVLRHVGQLLKRTFTSEDIVGRWGGGEFVVGMCGLSRYDGVQRLAEVLEALRPQRFSSMAGAEFGMSFSAGVAEYAEDGADLQTLYRAAEETSRQATLVGGDRVLPVGWSAVERRNLSRVDVALVMADEAEASLLLNSFRTRGYRTRWMRNGRQAAKALSGSVPKLKARAIVLDADPSGLDGLELLRRLVRNGVLHRSRVIVVTAPSVEDEVAAALKLGAFDHVAKPFSIPVLVQRVRRALEAR